MPRALKVYGWQGYRSECPPQQNGGHQTREIVAATSQRDAARLAEARGPWQLFNLCETGNTTECRLAQKTPGVVFWRSIDDRSDDPSSWQPATRKG